MKNGEILETYLCVDVAQLPSTGEGYYVYTYKVPMSKLNNIVQGPTVIDWENIKQVISGEKGE